MRLLHVHDRAEFQGGVEQILFDTARGLAARGWPQALLSQETSPDPEYTQPFEYTAVDRSIIAEFQPDVVLMHKVSDTKLITEVTKSLPAAHMVHDHDMVCPRRHKYFPVGQAACNLPAGTACYTHLCCVQRSDAGSRLPIQIKGTGEVRRQLRATQKVRRFFVGSAYMQRELEINSIQADRIRVVHPVPAALQAPQYREMSSTREILFVGQIIRGKGVDLMLRALALLEGEWKATIVGDGNHLGECQALAKRLDISDRVKFTGWIDHTQLDDYYSAARLVVVPSRWPEPFGMVGIEAMSRGRPVVAFDSGGISDWLNTGISGFLLPAADINAMASAIQKLLENRALARKMGKAATEHVRQSFSHQVYLDQVTEQLEHIR